MTVANIGVIGDDPIALVLLGLLGRAGHDPILIALQSSIAERLQWMGLRLSGSVQSFVERWAFTVCCEDLNDLPERSFDFLIVSGGCGFDAFANSLPSCPALIDANTKIVVLQNDPAYESLQLRFPGQVFRSWIFGNFDVPNPQTEPFCIHTRPATPTMYVESFSLENIPALHSLTGILSRAGIAAFPIQRADMNDEYRK